MTERILMIAGLIAVYAYMGASDEAEREYTRSLEKVLAKCLQSSSGSPITIGGEVFLCGASPTGIKL